jgi:hypothetical protein
VGRQWAWTGVVLECVKYTRACLIRFNKVLLLFVLQPQFPFSSMFCLYGGCSVSEVAFSFRSPSNVFALEDSLGTGAGAHVI